MSIHATALVDASAEIHDSVEVGPYAIIGENVKIGPGCKIGPYVMIHENVTMGAENVFHAHAVIGDAPQHLAYKGEPREVIIGNRNIFREHTTVHRSYEEGTATTIGDDCLFMVASHVGHDSHVGNRVILTNGALLGGHVDIADNVIMSGNSAIHQFVKVGRFAMIRGMGGATKDVPPFVVVREINNVCGINTIGLRRAGFSPEARKEIKQAFRILFRQGNSVPRALEKIRAMNPGPEAMELVTFVENSKRGICSWQGGVDAE
ncbi:MAG: acyl-ACP--UDP-N-acetylglucosamine O-acyltransferase [Candidatus Sumerlaeia bacterium]